METSILTQDHHIIEKFREMVAKRYDYDALVLRMQVPPAITREVIGDVKTYFLGTVYPEASERKRLEAAFGNLAAYVRQPKKIWGLFGNMAGALFKFGRHFMQALKAGFASLDSFMGAKRFEQNMTDIANRNGIKPPMTDEDYEDCFYQLERAEVEQFVNDVKVLFGAMANTTLLKKTVAILDDVISTMEKNPKTYPAEDVEGIKLGRALLQQGYDLFSKYDEDTKEQMVAFIFKNEMWYLDYIYTKKEDSK
jgi:hypothetical protein